MIPVELEGGAICKKRLAGAPSGQHLSMTVLAHRRALSRCCLPPIAYFLSRRHVLCRQRSNLAHQSLGRR